MRLLTKRQQESYKTEICVKETLENKHIKDK